MWFCHSLLVKDSSTQLNRIHNILEQLHGQRPRGLRLQLKALRGGLESLAVFRVKAEFEDNRRRRQTSRMVVKQLAGTGAREAAIYEKS